MDLRDTQPNAPRLDRVATEGVTHRGALLSQPLLVETAIEFFDVGVLQPCEYETVPRLHYRDLEAVKLVEPRVVVRDAVVRYEPVRFLQRLQSLRDFIRAPLESLACRNVARADRVDFGQVWK